MGDLSHEEFSQLLKEYEEATGEKFFWIVVEYDNEIIEMLREGIRTGKPRSMPEFDPDVLY